MGIILMRYLIQIFKTETQLLANLEREESNRWLKAMEGLTQKSSSGRRVRNWKILKRMTHQLRNRNSNRLG